MGGLCGMIIRSEAWPRLDMGAAASFIEASEPGVIFLRGAPSWEAERIAVMLRELRLEMVGVLRVAVGRTGAEALLQRQLGLGRLPGVAWVGGGEVLIRLQGAPRWGAYVAATDVALTRISRIKAGR